MDRTFCKDCQHYIQHYALGSQKLYRVYCGHCIRSAVKRKVPDAPICEHYSPCTPDPERFATKEYLSKELLRYVLDLDLLPEIEEAPPDPGA